MKTALKPTMVSMTKKSFIKEHKELVKTLRSGNKKKLIKEAKSQAKELREKS